MNGQKIVAEVFRINATSNDQKMLDFDTELMNTLEEIKLCYLLELEYEMNEIDADNWDMKEFKRHVEKWLMQKRLRDETIYYREVKVVVLQNDLPVDSVVLLVNSGQ